MATINREFFVTQYRDEVNDHIRRITERLFQLEEQPGNPEQIIEEIFRIAHTMKGSSRMMGYADVSALAHKMEDLLVEIRDGHLELHAKIIDLLFYCLDTINYLVEGVAKNVKRTTDMEQFSRLFAEVIAGKDVDVPHLQSQVIRPQQAAQSAETAQVSAAPEHAEELEDRQYIRIHTGDLDAILNLVGELIINQHRYESRRAAYQEMLDGLRGHRAMIAQLQKLTRNEDAAAECSPVAACADGLDSSSAALLQQAKTLFKRARTDSQHMRVAINNLQEQVFGVRMVSASRIFALLPRLVRMTARKLGKKIDLRILGEETRIDSRIIEEMRDPLIHLVQNAIHHGIEPPEKRKNLGKNPTGTLTIAAAQEGNRILITVRDDGQGIQSERIRDRALKDGLLSHRDIKAVSEQELFELLFHPGFSTSETVDDIAGRGFGLDIVRQHVDRVQGEIDVRSHTGQGAEFVLKLPLTLTIMDALLVKVADEVFAIPTIAVEKTFDITAENIDHLGKTPVIIHDNALLPVVELRRLLSSSAPETPVAPLQSPDSRHTVIVLQAEERRLGFLVDDLVEEREIVIKHLGPCLRRVRNVAGATTVRGDVVIILFVRDLIRSADSLLEGVTLSTPAARREPRSGRLVPRVLLVEDSPNTREVQRMMLEEAGYDVLTAEHGAIALSMLRNAPFDLVITDIEMPEMDGLTLTKTIKRDDALRQIPVIIVSTKSSAADRQNGLNAGAQAYITKGAFDDEAFLKAVDECLL